MFDKWGCGMSEIKIKKCDLCKKEHRSDENRHWSDHIGLVSLNFEQQHGTQSVIEHDLCNACASRILTVIQKTIEDITITIAPASEM